VQAGRYIAVCILVAQVVVLPVLGQINWTKDGAWMLASSDTLCTDGHIPAGNTGKGDVTGTFGSCVIKDGSTYKMWYTGNNGNYRIYYATSTDGINWTKLNNTVPAASDTVSTYGRIPLGSNTKGDDVHVLYPSVIKDGSIYKMWYTASDGANYRIYYATSPNGLTWTKYNNDTPAASDTAGTAGRIPLGSTAGRGDTSYAFACTVIKDGATYKMWYTGYNGVYRIYYATSPDGITWTKLDNTVPTASDTTSSNGRIPTGTAGKLDVSHTGYPYVLRAGGRYIMYYSGYLGSNWRIAMATSWDGLTWTKCNNTVLAPSDISGTAGRIPLGIGLGDIVYTIRPSVLQEADGFTMWYTGYNIQNRIYRAKGTYDYSVVSNRTPENVTGSGATLCGTLVAEPRTATRVRVYYGLTDGGVTRSSWTFNRDLGIKTSEYHSTNVASLTANRTYFYRFYGTNSAGESWSDTAQSFLTGQVWLQVTDGTATETVGNTAAIRVCRPPTSTNGALVVSYTVDGTASNGVDYAALSGSVTIPAGQSNATVTITPTDDIRMNETNETVILTLSGGAYQVGSPSTASVTIQDNDPLARSWRYESKVTFSGYDRNETLTNFPVLLKLGPSISGFKYSQFSSANGYDLRFLDADGTELYYEFESWTNSGTSYVWVRVPELSPGSDSIWAYWGNPAATTRKTYTTNGLTWHPTHAGVWHLGSTISGGRLPDSSTNFSHATPFESASQNAIVGRGRWFDGSNDRLNMGDVLDQVFTAVEGAFTLNLWYRPGPAVPDTYLFTKFSDTENQREWVLRIYMGSKPEFIWYGALNGGSYVGTRGYTAVTDTSKWYNIVATYNSMLSYNSRVALYVNGTAEGLTNDWLTGTPAAIVNGAAPLALASKLNTTGATGGNYIKGAIDEVRILPFAASSNWLWASWFNMASNSSFMTYGTVTSNLTTEVLPATRLTPTTARLNGLISHAAYGENPSCYVCWDVVDHVGGPTSAWANVRYAGSDWNTGMQFFKDVTVAAGTYYCRTYVSSSKGTDWSDAHIQFTVPTVAVVNNTGAQLVRRHSAVLTGSITGTGNQAPSVFFHYWPQGGTRTSVVSVGTQTGSFSAAVADLKGATRYYCRIAALNSAGTVLSVDRTFDTSPYGTGWYVASSGDGTVGTNWTTAFKNIQDALNQAESNDSVYVKGQVFPVSRQINWTPGTGVKVRGGYQGVGSPGSFNPVTWPTQIRRSNVAVTHRLMGIRGANDGLLYGITFTNGYAYGPHPAGSGGGVFAASCVNLTVEACTFVTNRIRHDTGNGGDIYGAGLFISGGSGVVTNSTFKDNRGETISTSTYAYSNGGGISLYGGVWQVTDCMFFDNFMQADYNVGWARGAGVHIYSGRNTINRCVFRNNRCWSGRNRVGDGVFINVGTNTIRNSLIFNGQYQGIYQGGAAKTYVQNCTIVSNGENAIYMGAGSISCSNSVLWGHNDEVYGLVDLYYNNIRDETCMMADGNIATDPGFADWTYYHLKSPYGRYANGFFSGGTWTTDAVASELIDACSPSIVPTKELHPNGGIVNMGAYGNTPVASKSHPIAITNLPPSGIGPTFARLNGRLDHIGSANVRIRIYWGLANGSNNPAAWYTNSYLGIYNSPQDFSKQLTGLIDGSTYYYTCFASNSSGTNVWCQPSKSFKAELKPPELINTGVLNEFGPSVTLKGTVTSTGGNTPRVFVCWGYQEGNLSSTASWQHVDVVGLYTSTFTKAIATVAKSNYFYTCFATNSAGSAWASPPLPFGYYDIRYVATNAAGRNTGYNWADAYTTIQKALQNCKNSKTNLIYLKGQTTTVYSQLQITNTYVVVRGGYQGSTGTPGAWDPLQWPTVITNRTGSLRLLRIFGCTNVFVEHIRFEGGNAPTWGGAAHVSSGRNIYFRNCLFNRNTALERGGSLYLQNINNVQVRNCIIQNSTLNRIGTYSYGGGIYVENCSGLISNTVVELGLIYGPSAYDRCWGGGIYLTGGGLTVRDSFMRYNRNVATYYGYPYGGGLYVDTGSHTIKNCVIAGNHIEGNYPQGGGAFVNNGTVTFENCTIAANQNEGLRRAGGTVTARDSIFWRNTDDITGTVTLTYCDIEDGTSKGVNGNISVNPRFERGLYLQPSSPAINTGSRTVAAAGLATYTTLTNGTLDIGTVDMGYHSVSGLSDMAELYVDSANGDDEYSGKDWPNAFRSITKATQVAPEGTRIHVKAGTYSWLETFPITVRRYGLQLIGAGWNSTIIDANQTNSVMKLYDHSFGRIEGLRIQEGRVDDSVNAGGGIYVGYSHNTVIKSCIVSNNYCGIHGGGIYVGYSSGILIDSCVAANNIVDVYPRDWKIYGGGIYLYSSYGAVSNCMVSGNFMKNTRHGWSLVQTYGGGIGMSFGAWTVVRTVINNNTCRDYQADWWGFSGGGVFVSDAGNHTLKNSLVRNNTVISYNRSATGHGIAAGSSYIAFSGVLNIENCNVLYNSGEGISRTNGSINVTNSIVWGNGNDIDGTVNLSYSVIEDPDTGPGCMNVNPQFAELTHYHLKSRGGRYTGGYFSGGSWVKDATTSPLVDRGYKQSNYSGELMPNGKRINIGMYGGTEVAEKTFNPSTVIILL